jgi:hypothetical protein
MSNEGRVDGISEGATSCRVSLRACTSLSRWNGSSSTRDDSLHSTIESLLNQSHNKYSKYIICIKSYEESISYIFFT